MNDEMKQLLRLQKKKLGNFILFAAHSLSHVSFCQYFEWKNLIFQTWKCKILIVREFWRGKKHIDRSFRRISSVHYPSRDGKDASYEGWIAWKGVYLPPESVSHPLMLFGARVLFPFCALTWRAYNIVSSQGRGIRIKNESTKTRLLLIRLK